MGACWGCATYIPTKSQSQHTQCERARDPERERKREPERERKREPEREREREREREHSARSESRGADGGTRVNAAAAAMQQQR